MRSPRFSDRCLNAKADAACALLGGGYLLLYDGARPESADDLVDQAEEEVPLAVVRLRSPAFQPANHGRATARAVESVPGLRSGAPTWFRAVTKLGEAVFDGTCGPAPIIELGEAVFDGARGEEFDMYVNGEIEVDGEVRVLRLVYAESRG